MLKLTRKDVCSALQVPEHRIRAWMAHEPYKSRSTNARKARVFDITDLLLLAIAQTLEDKYKMRGEALDKVLPRLDAFLHRPQDITEGLVLIDLTDWSVKNIPSKVSLTPGILLDISPDQERITRYLGLPPAQTELPFGLNQMKKTNG